MKPFTRVLSAFAVGILLQGGVYLYLDQYIFAPTNPVEVTNRAALQIDICGLAFISLVNFQRVLCNNGHKLTVI